jgi:hypothetical protein
MSNPSFVGRLKTSAISKNETTINATSIVTIGFLYLFNNV